MLPPAPREPAGLTLAQLAEYAHEALWFLRTWALPVVLEDDVPPERLPSRFLYRRPARRPGPARGERPRILTWNIYRARYAAPLRASLARILPRCDIVLLQEVPVQPTGAFWDDPLCDAFHVAFAPYHQVERRSRMYPYLATGQAILSRAPFSAVEAFDQPTVTRYTLPRGHVIKRLVVYAQVAGRLGLWNAHLENVCGPAGRAAQIEHILDLVQARHDRCTVLGGDFNAVLGDRLERWLRALARAGFREDFPARRLPRLDRLFVKGGRLPCRFLPARGSDHRPLYGVLGPQGR